jgi:hypothetical protein
MEGRQQRTLLVGQIHRTMGIWLEAERIGVLGTIGRSFVTNCRHLPDSWIGTGH